MADSLQNKLNELKRGYLKKLEGVLSEFYILLEAQKIDYNEIYTKVHTISGTSGMYGLKSLSDISTEFEYYLKDIKNGIDYSEEELKNKFLKYVNSLKKNIFEGE